MLVDNPEDPLLGASLRGLVIIDGTFTIRSILINDEQVGRSTDEAFRIVQAFQHADKHGVVCPANWTPGKKTIIPDQVKMSEYFKNEEL
jgi:alkyl hydroperoxide reductase subunit AhpC